MKKLSVKLISAIVALSTVFQVAAGAFGGTYPASTGYSTFKGDRRNDSAFLTKSHETESDPSRVFEVDGVKFVLLDTDAEGNYYILSENPTVQRSFDDSMTTKVTLATYDAAAETPETKYEDDIAKFKEYGWKFDPQDYDNIGKWLNNEFLTEKTYWPESVKNNLVEKTYEVEGMQGLANLSTAKNYPNQELVTALTNESVIEPYTVTAKVVLPSYTEIKKYHDIIGYSKTGWEGFMLRTPVAGLSADSKTLIVRWGMGIKHATGEWNIFELDSNKFFARPSAFLNKDFFKNVKINVDAAGSVVRDVIKNNVTDEELKALGYTDIDIVKLSNQKMSWDWGNYPASDKAYATGEATAITGAIKSDSPEANLFTIGGRRFILLDRNAQGEYFVMADEEYGTSPIMGSAWNEAYRAMTDAARKALKPSEWLFDPTITDSPVWRLNNDKWGLLSKDSTYSFGYDAGYTGDNSKKVFPDAIADSVVEKTWNIEPATVAKGWQINSYGSDALKAEVEAYTNEFNSNATTQQVTAKIMLPSVTEINQYKDKIGFKNYNSASPYAGGFYTRTQTMNVSCGGSATEPATTWKAVPSYVQAGYKDAARNNVYFSNVGITDNKYMMRPVMWLEKDFFKNNKIDVATAGETVIAEMRDIYAPEDLLETYEKEEIETILDMKFPTWEWGNYPASDKAYATGEQKVMPEGIIGASPKENLFTIGGRRFILLDRNEDGEYFIMADEEYGTTNMMHGNWNVAYKAKTQDEVKAMKQEDWLFDIAVTDSPMWKLNNASWGLMSKNPACGYGYDGGYTGDKTKKVFPDAIADNAIEKTWNIEPATVSKGWKINSYGDATVKAEAEAYVNTFNAKAQTQQVTAKIMLPSATEYDQYKDKIGFEHYNENAPYAGILTRTQIMTITCGGSEAEPATTWTAAPAYVQVGTINAVRDKVYFSNISITDNKFMVRPVMWLKADFFKNNKIDVATAGKNVFAEMRDIYTEEDLADTYTEDEIAVIFGTAEPQEPVSNVVFTSAGADIEDITKVSEITVSADFAKDKENCVMILSVYDKDGRVLNTGFTPVDMTDATETVTKTVTVKDFANAASCKVFVVDSFATLTPQFTASK